jgi:putative phosphoribosyl transferase
MTSGKLFRDRVEAGQDLAARLRPYRDLEPIVLGLPRGGVPVAYEVARELGAPLDVCVVRKIGAPMQPELGVGAVSEEGVVYLDHDAVRMLDISEDELAGLIEQKRAEVEERVLRFRHGLPPLDVRGRTVLLVDDGIATGGTARAAIQTLRARGAGRIVLAVPVGAADTLDALAAVADLVVCPAPREAFYAVGLWYDDFRATTDEEVTALLDRARAARAGAPSEEHEAPPARARSDRVPVPPQRRDVRISLARNWLEGTLSIPKGATGLVLFAHGSGSSRHSVRNRHVAGELEGAGLGTLLFDLLTEQEARVDEQTRELRFDVDLLASRLLAATDWVLRQPDLEGLDLGYFGASTGAAAALIAAAQRPLAIHAVVSRGGRPDLAEAWLEEVRAPTLLIVGSADREVLQLNREALAFLGCEKELEIVPGATHLFEEPGALEHVARSAAGWFTRHLGTRARGVEVA